MKKTRCRSYCSHTEDAIGINVNSDCNLKNITGYTRTQEHPDAITPQGPRSTQTPLQHKPPPGTQEHPDAVGPGGPRCNQTILDQEDPEVPQTSLDQEIPEAPIIL
ncbi:hypothetical protein STEG23_003354 [Scotinomys teguina]